MSSLPADLQTDFLDQATIDTGEATKYSNPDTRIKNLEAELRSAEQSLERIRSDISSDSNSYNARGELKRFGSDFFDSYQSTFNPINEPNLNPEYLLDVGDQLTITILGQGNRFSNKDSKIRVSRDGSVNIRNVGQVFVAGLPLEEGVKIIKQKISDALIGAESFVSLSQLRDISVLIVGNVNNPGIYNIAGGSNPLALINVAGGIAENGTYRRIIHKRSGEVIAEIDLYDVFVEGDLSIFKQLRSGDSIVVGEIKNEVQISGGIAKPGRYEIMSNESLENLLSFAGHISNNNTFSKITLERRESGNYKSLIIDLTEIENISLLDGDSIEIPYVKPIFNQAKRVKITGEVKIPIGICNFG